MLSKRQQIVIVLMFTSIVAGSCKDAQQDRVPRAPVSGEAPALRHASDGATSVTSTPISNDTLTSVQLCGAGAAADSLVAKVRGIMEPTDNKRRRDILLRAPAVPPDSISVVEDPEMCRRASQLFRRVSGPGQSWTRNEPVVVVRAADYYYFVQDETTARQRSDYWEVQVYDSRWEAVTAFGEGQ